MNNPTRFPCKRCEGAGSIHEEYLHGPYHEDPCQKCGGTGIDRAGGELPERMSDAEFEHEFACLGNMGGTRKALDDWRRARESEAALLAACRAALVSLAVDPNAGQQVTLKLLHAALVKAEEE